MHPEVEALKYFFAAVNRNDMQAMTRDFDPQIVRVEPEGFPTAGTYRGIAEVRENVTAGRGTWAEGSCDPEKFLVNGEKIVVYLHAWVRQRPGERATSAVALDSVPSIDAVRRCQRESDAIVVAP